MIPFDVVDVLKKGLAKDRRPSDGLLHCSSDLIGSLRHAQLACAGAPRIESELVSDVRLRTGTMWHSYFNELLIAAGKSVVNEVKLSHLLPEGWSGTADWLFWHEAKRAFVLGDLKSIKGEGLKWIAKDGLKEEHLWQLSAYYWALREGRYPMVKGLAVLYLPMNDVPKEDIEPVLIEAEPLPRDLVWGVMEDRWAKTKAYLDQVNSDHPWGEVGYENKYLGAGTLAPPMERVQKLFKNKGKLELKLVPHWSAQFCPYPDELCDCNTQGVTKIGEWMDCDGVDHIYYPRKGYEDIEPAVAP